MRHVNVIILNYLRVSYNFMYLFENDISTVYLHNDVLARSLTQFVVVTFFFRQRQRQKNERRRCMNHQLKGTYYIRAPIPYDYYQK